MGNNNSFLVSYRMISTLAISLRTEQYTPFAEQIPPENIPGLCVRLCFLDYWAGVLYLCIIRVVKPTGAGNLAESAALNPTENLQAELDRTAHKSGPRMVFTNNFVLYSWSHNSTIRTCPKYLISWMLVCVLYELTWPNMQTKACVNTAEVTDSSKAFSVVLD